MSVPDVETVPMLSPHNDKQSIRYSEACSTYIFKLDQHMGPTYVLFRKGKVVIIKESCSYYKRV